jgi:metal-responsive CopG/Arc/MetJ family transcriptional regulator
MISNSPRPKKRTRSAPATTKQQARKVAVDFPAPLFQETERAARELSTSRSFFIRSAVERFLAELRRQKLDKELAAGYIANDLQATSLAEELAQLDADLI